ncbi:MAG: asparagine synthase-related protein [Gemmatimonadota bacterium]
MDTLVAVLGGGRLLSEECTLMLDAVWPTAMRVDARFAGEGIVLAASRTVRTSLTIGMPMVHGVGATRTVRRFDWPTLGDDAPRRAVANDRHERPAVNDPMSMTWDSESRTLVVVRDAMGESAVWYASDAGRLAVATHPAALRTVAWVSNAPDPLAVSTRAARLPLAADETCWRDIRRLPPGHLLVARDGGITISRWFDLRADGSLGSTSDAEWLRRVRTALERAVARRIPVAGTLGAQLSGGLDSTAVSLLASRALVADRRTLYTFSHVPPIRWHPPQPGDETPFVRAALDMMPGAIAYLATGERGAVTTGRDDPSLAHDAEVRDAARAAQVTTMLSGWGGDEGISYNGDGYLTEALLRGRLFWVLRWCRRFGGGTHLGMLATLYHKVIEPQRGTALRGTRLGAMDAVALTTLLGGLPKDMAQELRQRAAASRQLRSAISARRNQYRLLHSAHLGVRTDDDASWSVPAGFVFRYPLLDPELLGVVLAAPSALCLRSGRTRGVLRGAMEGTFPPAIAERHGKFVPYPGRPVFVTER